MLATSLLAAKHTLALPAAGQSTALPPEDDGSTFTWPGATTETVDVEPWGDRYGARPCCEATPYSPASTVSCRRSDAPCTFSAGRPEVDVHGVPSGYLRRLRRRTSDKSLHADDLRCCARRGCGVQRPLRAAVAVSTGSDAQRERLRDLPHAGCVARARRRPSTPSEQLDHAARDATTASASRDSCVAATVRLGLSDPRRLGTVSRPVRGGHHRDGRGGRLGLEPSDGGVRRAVTTR